ncbi:MAG TPA: S8 family serine peptidase, partial [Candidatus Acidoferrum sp.]|nr:S8 family serine peptidase [Candidatus Acidoferrum sp.]
MLRLRLTASVGAALLLFGSVASVGAAPAPVPTIPTSPAATATPDPAVPESVSRTDQVIVRWSASVTGAMKPGPAHIDPATSLSAIRSVSAAGAGTRFVRSTATGASIYRLSAPLGADAARTLAALSRLPGVASVEPDLWMTPDALPNDPYASLLWGLLGAGDGSPFGIDAQGAWPTTTGSGVTVAVIDTGLLFNHPDLIGQSVPGYDMISNPTVARDGNGRDADASDPGDSCQGEPSSWHGTHVAGTIAALANNAIGVFGGAPGVKIEPVRAIGMCGGYETDVADAIVWAAGGSVAGVPANPHPARVLNLSLSAPDSICPPYFSSAIASARAHGAVVVVAAGNESIDARLDTPANCPAAITVAAVDSSGLKPDFSNFGPGVDLAGPGVGIWSTVDTGTNHPVGAGYAAYDGTSMATPHVALSAALLAAAFPSLSPDAIEFVLKSTATQVASDSSSAGCPALGCGAGIVDAGRAVAAVAAPMPLVGSVATTARYPRPSALITVSALTVAGAGVAGAELRIDAGAWTAMTAVDGVFGGASETVSATLTAPPTEGTHTICVRATDTHADMSDGTSCTTIVVDAGPPVVSTPELTPATAGQGEPVAVRAVAVDGLAVTSAQVRVDG